MRILIGSHAFFPHVGGIETVSMLLAHGFLERGHEVRVVTRTRTAEPDGFPFQVVRFPPPARLIEQVRWCDLFLQNNISLRTAWPLLFVRRPWVITHQGFIFNTDGPLGVYGRLKSRVLRFATCISISRAIADYNKAPSRVIPNPYDDQVFREYPNVERDRELAFLGRLVPEKGGHLVLDALVRLRERGLRPTLTFIGGGSQEPELRRQTAALGLSGQVQFAGVKRGRALAELLNRHRILVAPSVWQEPFGVVALEGIACGCVVVGSEGGGLKDAIGPCGVTFPNGDVAALSERLEALLTAPDLDSRFRSGAAAHLARHTQEAVIDAYLEVLRGAFDDGRARRPA